MRVPKDEALRAPTMATQGRVAGIMFKDEICANFLAGEIFALCDMFAAQLIRFDPFAAGQIGQGL